MYLETVNEWFERIYSQRRDKLLRAAYGLMKDKTLAEDMVQNVFAIMLVKYERLKEREKIEGWLVDTLKFVIMTENQRAYHSRELSMLPGFDAPAAQSFDERFEDLLPAELTKEEREILCLYIEAGYSHGEIAEMLGCSVTACRMRYSRARRRCEKLLRQQYPERFSQKNPKEPLHSADFDKYEEQEVQR